MTGRRSHGRLSALNGVVHQGTDGLKGFEELKAAGVTHVARTQPRQGDLRQGAPSVVPQRTGPSGICSSG